MSPLLQQILQHKFCIILYISEKEKNSSVLLWKVMFFLAFHSIFKTCIKESQTAFQKCIVSHCFVVMLTINDLNKTVS